MNYLTLLPLTNLCLLHLLVSECIIFSLKYLSCCLAAHNNHPSSRPLNPSTDQTLVIAPKTPETRWDEETQRRILETLKMNLGLMNRLQREQFPPQSLADSLGPMERHPSGIANSQL